VKSKLELGAILNDRFRIEAQTEWGAIAWDTSLERAVEIEPLPGDSAVEAQRLAAIIHPHLQAIYAVQLTPEGESFVVREHLSGVLLDEWAAMYEGALPVNAAIGILDPIALALDALHEGGRAHGSLDWRHVVVGPSFRVAVLSPHAGRPSEAAGTMQDDLRALGALTHRLLTGQDPKPGVAPSQAQQGLSRAFDRPLARMLGDDPFSAETFRQRLAVAQAFAAATPLAHTILLVDQDHEFRELLASILRQAFPDARFMYEESGKSALNTLRQQGASLIVSEMKTTDLDGFDLARAIRKEPTAAETPVLVVTGEGDATDWQVLSDIGVDAFLFKPVDATSLIASARRLIGAPEPPRFPDAE